MKTYTVQITNEALNDMEQIYHYIAETLLSPESALKQYNKIAEKILSLNTFPERFHIIGFQSKYPEQLRRMPVDNYSVFYVIDKSNVIITNILYSASDIEDRLQKF